MTLEEIRAEYDRLDRQLGLDTREIALSFSGRMTSRFGVCVFLGNRPTAIRLAAFLQGNDAALLETALHEYAHAAAALRTGVRHGHDAVWKALCREIGCAPKRLAEPCPEQVQQKQARLRYTVRCCRCGAQTQYQKRGPVVRALQSGRADLRCRRCGGRKFLLTTEKQP